MKIAKWVLRSILVIVAIMFLFAGTSSAESADEAFDRSMDYYFKGNSWTAKDILAKNIAENPTHSTSYSGMAFIHAMGLIDPLYRGTADDARAYVKKANEIGPDNKWNHLALVVIAISKYIRGDLASFNSVVREAKKTIEVDPNAGEAYFMLWVVNKFLKGDKTAADENYRLALLNGSKYINMHYLFYYSQSFFGTCEAAVDEAKAAYGQDPINWEVYTAWEKPDVGDISELALADCNYWKAMKSQYMGGGDEEKAAKLKEALRHAPGFMFAAGEFVNLFVKEGKTSEAEKFLLSNSESNPHNVGAAISLASFYADTVKDNDKLKKALSRIPDGFNFRRGPYTMLYYKKLAYLYTSAGDTVRADEMTKKAEIAIKDSLY